MSIIEYRSTLTVDRIKRKNSKDSMAIQLFEAYHLICMIMDSGCAPDIKSRAEKLQTRIAWGE